MPPSQSTSRFSSNTRTVPVTRLIVQTTEVDRNYARVEMSINGVEFEFSGPDAQVVGAHLNTAGGGEMYAKTGAEDTIRRAYRALSNIDDRSPGSHAKWSKEAREILRAAVESYG